MSDLTRGEILTLQMVAALEGKQTLPPNRSGKKLGLLSRGLIEAKPAHSNFYVLTDAGWNKLAVIEGRAGE